tara:strand:- start:13038 stop:13181 length:144 start_codon:yes stop_codon:yes gene_type:complete
VIVVLVHHVVNQRLNAQRQQQLKNLAQKTKNKKGFDYIILGVNSSVV